MILSLQAHLWDGSKKLSGQLTIDDDRLTFAPIEFVESSLSIILELHQIKTVKRVKVYDVMNNALEVVTVDGRRNVFVFVGDGEDVLSVKEILLNHIKS